ncbi:hypothetical protein CK556_02085 [Mesoplasma chauliocola]|uniref:PvuRts1 I-like SET and RING associated domain-containing protein n=1 Tax=Mesoplasma chauliocola TaxID=216427 RepID=A0A249SNA4_9MOLU|nr:hypothetical protein [Mesoplasma chauliocola]ASZ09145.1 hypothetical protein CK556_02085 [Mesoplasma chauliocola]
MDLEVLNSILESKKIRTKDRIKFNKIIDVLNSLFIDQNKQSILKVGYKINDKRQVWFPNITLDVKKSEAIKEGYGNFISENWDLIYQFNAQKDIEKRKKDIQKIKKFDIEYVTFAKINDKIKGIGYHFVGIFKYDSYEDINCEMIVFKKVSDSFKFEW